VGTTFGEAGVNIGSAAVGHGDADLAVMVVTTDTPVPQELVDRIVALDDFVDGRAVTLV
jgi:hypothetical protein